MKLTKQQQKLAIDNHNLIYHCANKLGLELEEWYDILAIALCKACATYVDGKSKFSTYAIRCMQLEVAMEIRKMNQTKRKAWKNRVEETNDIFADRSDMTNLIATMDMLKDEEYQELIKNLIAGDSQETIAKKLQISQTSVCRNIRKLKERYGIDG